MIRTLSFCLRATWLLLRVLFHAARWSLRALRWGAVRLFRRPRHTFGSARWATLGQLLNGDALGATGLIAGKRWGRLLRYQGEGAMLVYAPQGSGKGVGVFVKSEDELDDFNGGWWRPGGRSQRPLFAWEPSAQPTTTRPLPAA